MDSGIPNQNKTQEPYVPVIASNRTSIQPNILIPPQELDESEYINYGAFFIGIFGMLGNGFVLFILFREKRLRKKISNMLITNQCLVDFISSMLFIVCFGSKSVDKSYEGLSGTLVCVLLDSEGPVWLFLCISTSGLVLITLERYMIIVHPLKYRNNINHCSVKLAIVATWFLTSALVGILLFYTSGVKDGKCYTVGLWPSKTFERSYCIFYIAVTFLGPVCLFVGCYSHMMVVMTRRIKLRYLKSQISMRVESGTISTLREDKNPEQKISRKQINLTRTMIIVCVCFVVCFGPSNVHYFLTTFELVPGLELSGALYTFLTYVVFCNSWVNPLIYAFKYEDVKKGARKILKIRNDDRSVERQSQSIVRAKNSELAHTSMGLSVSTTCTLVSSDMEISAEISN